MKNDSDIFDSIRIKPNRRRGNKASDNSTNKMCEWSGCENEGKYRAPKGRGKENEYHYFCIEHVKQYNKNYNYFVNMSDDEIKSFQKDSLTGHRPTWKVKAGGANVGRISKFKSRGIGIDDNELNGINSKDEFNSNNAQRPRRKARNAEKASLIKLGLDEFATPEEVKNRFKLLVKNLHPDLNKDKQINEERLKDVIQAYNYLKSSGFFKKD